MKRLKEFSTFLCAIAITFMASAFVHSQKTYAVPQWQETRAYTGTNGMHYCVKVWQDDKSGDVFSQVWENQDVSYIKLWKDDESNALFSQIWGENHNKDYDFYEGKKFPYYPEEVDAPETDDDDNEN